MKKRNLIYTILALALVATTTSSISMNNSSNSEDSRPATNDEVTITWKYDSNDGIKTEITQVPAYQVPTAPKTAEQLNFSRSGHDYKFDAWNPAISVAIPGKEYTYTASFTSKAVTHKITFDAGEEGKWSDGSRYKIIEALDKAYPEPGETPTHPLYHFDGWSPKVDVATCDTTYVAKYDLSTKHSLKITCDGCTVNGATTFCSTVDKGEYYTYKFDIPSDYKVHGLPYRVDVQTEGGVESIYDYDETTGSLSVLIRGNTTINAYADNSSISLDYHYIPGSKEIGFICTGATSVNWGDGTISTGAPFIHQYGGVAEKDYKVRIIGNTTSFSLRDNSKTDHPYIGADNNSIVHADFYHTTKDISDYAFYNSNLKKLRIYNDITYIGAHAFDSCDYLNDIGELPESITTIEGYAFNKCKKLVKVNIPSKVTTISTHLFYGCSALTDLKLHDGIDTIENYAFSSSGLTSFVFPSLVNTVGVNLFDQCRKLESVTLHEGMTDIGGRAFSFTDSLNSIVLPSTIETIGYQAFMNSKIKSIHLATTSPYQIPKLDDTFSMFEQFLNTSNLKIYANSVLIKEKIEESWWEKSSPFGITKSSIVAPAYIDIESSVGLCFYTLDESKGRPTTGVKYEGAIKRKAGVTAYPYDIKVKNGDDILTSGYTYNNLTGAFTIEGEAITRNITVIADWTHEVNFRNYNHELLYGCRVVHSQNAIYKGPTPTKGEDEQYTYTFKGWDVNPNEKLIEDDAEFFATFEENPKLYTITFKLDSHGRWKDTPTTGDRVFKLGYGATVTPPEPVESVVEGENIYVFKGWSSPIRTVVDGPATYTAKYLINDLFTVEWYNDKNDTTPLLSETYQKGALPCYSGDVKPTKVDPVTGHVFTFINQWKDEDGNAPGPITRDMKFYAQFDNEISVSFKGINCEVNYLHEFTDSFPFATTADLEYTIYSDTTFAFTDVNDVSVKVENVAAKDTDCTITLVDSRTIIVRILHCRGNFTINAVAHS